MLPCVVSGACGQVAAASPHATLALFHFLLKLCSHITFEDRFPPCSPFVVPFNWIHFFVALMRVWLLNQDWNGNIKHLLLQLNARLSSRSWTTCSCCQWDPSFAFLIETMWGIVMLAFFHKTCKCVQARKARRRIWGCSFFFLLSFARKLLFLKVCLPSLQDRMHTGEGKPGCSR